MALIVQVTKEEELKVLQQRITKERENHQQRTVYLDQFQEETEKLARETMEILVTTQEARDKLLQVSKYHIVKHEVKEYSILSIKVKEEFKHMRTEHGAFKAKLNQPFVSI